MLRKIVLFVIIIISYLLQTTCKGALSIGNIAPNIIIVVIASFALLRGKKEGMFIGFFAGLLIDLYYGYSGTIGLSSIIYMYIGYIIGIFHDIIYTDDITIPILFTALADIVSNFMFYVIAFLLRNKLDIKYYFMKIMLPELVYTVFIGIFLYKLFKIINNKLENHERRGENKYGSRDIGDYI